MRRAKSFRHQLADEVADLRGGTKAEWLANWLEATLFIQQLMREHEEPRRDRFVEVKKALAALTPAERDQFLAEWIISREGLQRS